MVELVESFQLALFLREPPGSTALAMWSKVVRDDPTAFQTIAPNVTQAQGIVDGAEVTFLCQNNRIDVLLQGAPAPDGAQTARFLAAPDEALATGRRLVKSLIEPLKVGRTAAVVQGFSLAENQAGAVAKLKILLPSLLVPANGQDVNFQVAVPFISGIDGKRALQRMCRWRTALLNLVDISIGAGVPTETVVTQQFAAHMHVDVFAVAMETLDAEAALQSLEEVSDVAYRTLRGGYDELARA